ncbi:IS3 family transposase [Bifidobacterium tibiigranuli]|nr:IS3 family transposase [Bifidobacterium tibiigranuli]
MNAREVVRRLGWPSRSALASWVRADARFRPHRGGRPRLPERVRAGAVLAYRGGMSLRAAARRHGVSDASVARWSREWDAPAPAGAGEGGQRMELDDSLLPDDPEALKAIIRGQRLENDVLREVVALVKKDPAADPRRLSNREKTLMADRLRPTHSLSSLASRLKLALSSYHYHHARLGRDRHDWLRPLVHEIFGQAKGRYGSRRIHATLRAQGTTVSEKVVRRVMRQEGLAARSSRKPRRYSSYIGECSPAPDNLIRRDFHAEEPDQKWLTDITEIKARDGKVYLSPVLDCFDGRIVAYSIGRHPDAELANSSLRQAIATLGEGGWRPLVHSDRGGHYRWPGWISIMQESELRRSMSAKGCSPDNSAMEGFFGRMKTEATYPEHWERLSCAQAIARTREYIAWHNAERIKQSLGYRSPDQYRRAHGLMA